MFQRLRRLLPGFVILVAMLGVFASPHPAQGMLNYVATFQQPNIRLDVATYSDPSKGPGKSALLGMAAGSVKNSFAFASDEWPKLIDLTSAAARAQSSGGNWTVIGEIYETHTNDTSHLVISAGPGIRFALNSPQGASLTFILASGDIPRFQQALEQVREFFAAP
ncbi:MAG: hypothetical protein ABSG66_11115 [Stellaceae bacterium]|jgi:hypothetical protein